MNIKSAKYYKDIDGFVTNIKLTTTNDTIIHVPVNTHNRHYQAILEWVKIDGNSIADAD